MASRKCCISGCTSQEGEEKDIGVTFHRFPHNQVNVDKWTKACGFDQSFKPTKSSYVCSRHFKRDNFNNLSNGKIVLKSLTVPSIFPWNKAALAAKNTEVKVEASGDVKDEKKNEVKEEPEEKTAVKVDTEKAEPEVTTKSKPETTKGKQETPKNKPETTPKSKSNDSAKKKPVTTPKSPEKAKKSKRLSAKVAKVKSDTPLATPEPAKSSPAQPTTPKNKNQVVNFVPGSTIEAQNFDGKWMPVKVIEVDMEDREVLVRSCDKNKSKTGINDEWISMDSPRLRPAQPIVTFEVGEKVLARWNDCRKFPATVKRVLENDLYDVLFDDGYPKIVRGIHINKYNAKNLPKTEEPAVPAIINPLLLNPPSLIPEYIKEMKDIPPAPSDGEWCCTWVDDIPVGQESSFDGPHGKLPSIIVPDHRVKEGWQKHIYLRQNGKWDVLFISPTNRKLRFKNELKTYLAEVGEIYDPEVWDFSLHKKRSKFLGLCIATDKVKNQTIVENVTAEPKDAYSNPFASLGALPYIQQNIVLAAPTQTEVRVGALKVKVVDNIYQCPQDACDKTFRKENHLQLHIKHYHEDLSKLMGECLNMEDLAYLRTTVDEPEVTPAKPVRKSHSSKPKLNDSLKEIHVKTEPGTSPEVKFAAQRSPILEEALKAPLITNLLQSPTIKIEKDVEIKQEPLMSFDPESLIPVNPVSKPSHIRFGGTRKRLRMRFNPKPKKSGQKKRRMEERDEGALSSVPGIIPYHEGPYFKQQSGYVDDNGEMVKIVRMKKEEIINCICGFGEEDGLMIQCELCLCWQHGYCNGIESSHQVPEKYVCLICKNPHRQRTSQKYIHDQDWLYEGKLPIANYHIPNPKQTARFDTLKQCHTLIGNLKEMKVFMNSLDVKINIAEKRGHPKLYLWAKKWEESPPRENEDEKPEGADKDGDVQMKPIIPEPEVAIEPAKCQQTLLDHIQNQQKSVKARLEAIDAEITALEESSSSKFNGKVSVEEPKMKQTIFLLLNDLVKMNTIASIHRN